MYVMSLQVEDEFGNVVSEQRNLRNQLHRGGEEFLLRATFTGGRVSDIIPEDYYIGLDNRSAIAYEHTMGDIIGEPNVGGYRRQAISSSGEFSLNFESDHFRAVSPIVAFRSQTIAWGPVQNLFLSDQDGYDGTLISTVPLDSAIFLNPGQTSKIRIAMTMRELPDCSES